VRVLADNDIPQARVAVPERFTGDICLKWALPAFTECKARSADAGISTMPSGGGHFDPGREVDARHSGHEQCVCRSRHDFKYRAVVAAALA
jgi:hypothetical protein